MNGAEVLDIARDAVWITLQTAAPIMLIGLAVGVAIALVQALTQIQEMTLVFVPKIVAIFAALILFLPFMGASMGGLAARVFERIAAM
jgi:flagellar biosynthetic protein FliQ